MTSSHVGDTWEQGSAYDRYIGRWSRLLAPRFLSWLDLPPGLRWLDVGCGTGALSAAIADGCAPASVAGVEPSEGFRETARANLAGRAGIHAGSATEIPLENASVDVVVSGLVLNFVPESDAALAEMIRVTRPGGTVAGYVWDYAGRMEYLRVFWDAASALDPAAAAMDEGIRFPLCRPEPLEALFRSAGLAAVVVAALDIPTRFLDFEDYWRPFLGGTGPAPAYVASLDGAARDRLRDDIRARLPAARDGTIALEARAWGVRGTL